MEGPSLLEYAEDVAKAITRIMNSDKQGTGIGKNPEVPPIGQNIKFYSIISCQCWKNSTTEQLKDLMSIVKKNSNFMYVTKDRTA